MWPQRGREVTGVKTFGEDVGTLFLSLLPGAHVFLAAVNYHFYNNCKEKKNTRNVAEHVAAQL
jgi:hypothetical protein